MFDWNYVGQWMLNSCIAGGMLALSYLAYILTNLYYNIKVEKQEFDKERFIKGMLKLVVLVATGAILCFVAITFPMFLNGIGIVLDEKVAAGINIAAMILIYTGATIQYFGKARDKYKEIIECKNKDAVG